MKKQYQLTLVSRQNKAKTNYYLALSLNLGYREHLLSFDKAFISELTGIALDELYSFSQGTSRVVGSLVLGEEK